MHWRITNPKNVNTKEPYLYKIVVHSPTRNYHYVGKGSSPSRMTVYFRMVEQIRKGMPKCTLKTRDGRDNSKGNIQYRYVHLVLAVAVERGWEIEHYPLENCDTESHSVLERQRISEFKCDMNDGPSWYVEEYKRLAASVK